MSSIGSTPSLVVGIAAGAAASAALEPALEVPKQEAWQSAPNRLPDIGLVAALVAAGEVSRADAHNMGERLGFSAATLDSLVYLAQETPSFAEVLRMWRLFDALPGAAGSFPDGLVDHALAHSGLDWDYQPFLKALKHAELVGLGDVAVGVVRGALPAPSYMPVAPPTSGTSVPRFPQVDIDPEVLAAALGFSPEMLHLMIARSGLSLAPGLAANARFRNLINDQDFLLAIAEGDLRTEWAQTLLDVMRVIPTVDQMMEHALRGFETVDSAKTNAKRHGISGPDAQLIYDNAGRAPGLHAVTTALARGGNYDGTAQTIPEPYLSAVQRANVRPEWYDLEYANRYTYPSGFQIKSEAPIMGEALTEKTLLEVGWKPSLAKFFATHWSGTATTGASADKDVTGAQTRLKTTTHKSYLAGEISDTTATESLTTAGVAAAAIPAVLSLWQAERDLVRKGLTAANIKKFWTQQDADPTTGTPWTQAEAVAKLVALGYDQTSAEEYLVL